MTEFDLTTYSPGDSVSVNVSKSPTMENWLPGTVQYVQAHKGRWRVSVLLNRKISPVFRTVVPAKVRRL